ASAVASDEGNLRHLQRLEGHRVEEQDVRPDVQILDRELHGQLARAEDVDAIDLARLDNADRDGAGPREDHPADVEAVLVLDELRVVDAEQGRVGIEDHARGDDGTGETAAAHLI